MIHQKPPGKPRTFLLLLPLQNCGCPLKKIVLLVIWAPSAENLIFTGFSLKINLASFKHEIDNNLFS
jgi:membrane protease YdiL (CAAX protease family)